jgi:hypothetical protein
MRILFLLLLAAALLPAAERDFLTTDEADQVRLVQEPNERLKLYAGFAGERLALLEHLLSREEAGRSSLIHEALEDYTKIVETMDVVADDALVREVDVTLGIGAITDAEKDFLTRLEKIEESEPDDLSRYRFVLEMAIDTTRDSLEINQEDLAARQLGLTEEELEEQRELEEMMTPGMLEERREEEKEFEADNKEQERKIPTLLREGEKEQKEAEEKKNP